MTAAASDSTLARIIHAVEQAQGKRAPTQTMIDRFADLMVAAGAGVRRSGTTLSVVGLSDDDLFDLAASSVASSGARLRRLGQHRRTLDDIFATDATDRAAASLSGWVEQGWGDHS